jgi:hypothetical protein
VVRSRAQSQGLRGEDVREPVEFKREGGGRIVRVVVVEEARVRGACPKGIAAVDGVDGHLRAVARVCTGRKQRDVDTVQEEAKDVVENRETARINVVFP